MKVLLCPSHYVFDDQDRGSELLWAYKISNGIASKYVNSVVVTGSKNIRNEKKYHIVELQKHKKTIDLGILSALVFNFRYSWFLFKELRSGDCDVLHHVLPFGIDKTFNLAFIFGKKSVVKIIGPIQNPLPFYKDNIHDLKVGAKNSISIWCTKVIFSIFGFFLMHLSTKTLKRADKIIAISKTTRKMLLDKGVKSEKIAIIPPGVDCSIFTPLDDVNDNKSRLKIFLVGALIERKGFDLVIDAIAEVVRSHKNIVIKIAGDGPKRKLLEKKIKNLGLEKYIIFEGLINYSLMRLHYQQADIFVSMSRAESWGQMYLEAMACGLPIITTKNIGSNEIVKDGKFGFLVGQEDYKALAKKIVYFMENRHIMEEFSRAARKEAEEKYDWENVIIPQYLNMYEEMIRKG